MSSEIKTEVSRPASRHNNSRLLVLTAKIEGLCDDVNDACYIDGTNCVITASRDKSVRVWQRHDSGQFWPSVCEYMPSPVTCIDYDATSRRLFIGLDNGTITEFVMSADRNKIEFVRDYLAHYDRVTQCSQVSDLGWVVSVARDKTLQCYSTLSGKQFCSYVAQCVLTCFIYEPCTRHVFAGDTCGDIHMLELDKLTQSCNFVTTMSGHKSCVRCMSWDSKRQWLFSSGHDSCIIVWDIGSKKGTSYNLLGHNGKVVALNYNPISQQLISAGEDGTMVVWNMSVTRQSPPDWQDSDVCQICNKPFFWNLRLIYNNKWSGVNRQHHCRFCGKAICAQCSSNNEIIPEMGIELAARVCDLCHERIRAEKRMSLAVFHESKHVIMCASLDLVGSRYLTVGHDLVIKLWEIVDGNG